MMTVTAATMAIMSSNILPSLSVNSACILLKKIQAFTVQGVKPPEVSGKKMLWLKIDTGAAGNTLPFCTFHQMYSKDSLNCDILKPTPEVKLVSYSGDRIRCHGKITIPCKYRDSAWEPIMFYIVHVPGPAILGLRNNQSLGIVTLNVDEVTPKTLVKHEWCPDWTTSVMLRELSRISLTGWETSNVRKTSK